MVRYQGPIVDCDVHHAWGTADELIRYLPARWAEYARTTGLAPPSLHYPFPFGTNKRLDTFGPHGEPPGSSLEMLRTQLLDKHGITHAVLGFDVGQEMSHVNPHFATEVARAANDWSLEQWLTKDERLFGGILVFAQNPVEAAAEIRRVGERPEFVEVLLGDNGAGYPLGHPLYDPIFQAAEDVGLPIAIHFGSPVWGGHAQLSAGGLPLNRLEYYAVLHQPGMHHLASFLVHGVFEKYPGLRILAMETGLNWFPWLVAQLDAHYAELKAESPLLDRLPSEYVRRHVRLSTQPMEPGPGRFDQAELLATVDGMAEMICFASDYPHWDTDEVDYVTQYFPEDWAAGIFFDNAAALFGLTETANR